MTEQFTNLLIEHGSDIFTDGHAGIDFGPMHKVDAIALMAEREGLDTWISWRGNWIIETNRVEGSFMLRELPNGHIVLEAADADELNG